MRSFTNARGLWCGKAYIPGSSPDADVQKHAHARWQLHSVFTAFAYLQETIEELYSRIGFYCGKDSDSGMAASSTAKDETGSSASRASWNQRLPRRYALELSSADATTVNRQRVRESKNWAVGDDRFAKDLASSGPKRYGIATVLDHGDGDETTAPSVDAAQESAYEESWHGRKEKQLYTMTEMLAKGPGCLSESEAADLIILEDRAAFEALGWDRLGMQRRDQSRRQSRLETRPTENVADSSIQPEDDEEPSHSLTQQILHGDSPASPRSVDSISVIPAECSSNASHSPASIPREQR
nr:hypothetical protein CFP56_07890 [Quercus suber]